MSEVQAFDKAGFEFDIRVALLKEHYRSYRETKGDASNYPFDALFVPAPGTLKVYELNFALLDVP
jgi:hypothetical protein